MRRTLSRCSSSVPRPPDGAMALPPNATTRKSLICSSTVHHLEQATLYLCPVQRAMGGDILGCISPCDRRPGRRVAVRTRMARHFLSQTDLSVAEIVEVFDLTTHMKAAGRLSEELRGRTLVMFFEKASTRTRLSFEIGMTQMGGHAVFLDRESSQLSRGESVPDTARVVSRYAELLLARV